MDLTNFAHAFGQRYELPIPLLLFVLGGAGVVLFSFLLVLRREVARDDAMDEVTDTTAVTYFSYIWAAVSLVVFAALVTSGIVGSQEVAENMVPTLFWLIVWIAVPLSCGLVGDYTARLNPFAWAARLTGAEKVRKAALARSRPFAWPARLGWWPAVGLFFILACGELIFNQFATRPDVTAAGALFYIVFSAFMGLLYGEQWLQKGEVFSVLFSTWGKLGWFRFGAAGKRGFAGGLYGQPFQAVASRIAFVMLLLVSVGFDGLLATPLWNNFAHKLPAWLEFGSFHYQLFATAVFALIAVVFMLLFYGFASAVAAAGGYHETSSRVVLAGLLPSLLPISIGYLLAHNIEYLVVNGQLLFPLLGNPTGLDSWPLHLPFPFNDDYEVHPHLLPSAFYWYLSVGLIILVHVLAVILAHRRLAYQSADVVKARRSEYPWVVAMVAYTMLSLWLLAQPLVKEKTGESAKPSTTNISMVAKHPDGRA